MCIESSGWRSLGAALAALIVNSLIGVLAVVAAFLIEARAEVAYKGGLNPDAPYVPIFWFRFVGPILLFVVGSAFAEIALKLKAYRNLLYPVFLFVMLVYGFKRNPFVERAPAESFMVGRAEFALRSGLISTIEHWASTAATNGNLLKASGLKDHEVPAFIQELGPKEWPPEVSLTDALGSTNKVVQIRFGGGGGGWGFVVNPQRSVLPLRSWVREFRVTPRTYAFWY